MRLQQLPGCHHGGWNRPLPPVGKEHVSALDGQREECYRAASVASQGRQRGENLALLGGLGSREPDQRVRQRTRLTQPPGPNEESYLERAGGQPRRRVARERARVSDLTHGIRCAGARSCQDPLCRECDRVGTMRSGVIRQVGDPVRGHAPKLLAIPAMCFRQRRVAGLRDTRRDFRERIRHVCERVRFERRKSGERMFVARDCSTWTKLG